jgi:hypothetical protein
MTSLKHTCFLRDPRTDVVIGEPRFDLPIVPRLIAFLPQEFNRVSRPTLFTQCTNQLLFPLQWWHMADSLIHLCGTTIYHAKNAKHINPGIRNAPQARSFLRAPTRTVLPGSHALLDPYCRPEFAHVPLANICHN